MHARPADPAVLDSIIGSFSDLPSSPTSLPSRKPADERYAAAENMRRADSLGSAAAVPPVIARSPSAVAEMEHPDLMAMGGAAEEDEMTDVAPSPSIRTSRPASGLSRFNAGSPARSMAGSPGRLRPRSIASRASSLNNLVPEREQGSSSSRNKHSAENWIRGDPRRTSSGIVGRSRSLERRKSLRRVTSRETLRQPTIEDMPSPDGETDLDAISRAEQILARTPSTALTKARLYLSDSSASEEERLVRDSLISEAKSSDAGGSPRSKHASSSTMATEQTSPSPKRISPASAIADSIPTRTSSLRATSASPAAEKRKKMAKAKRATIAVEGISSPLKAQAVESETVVEMKKKKAEVIPESSWADLGEDDETVKRIRELREQRKSRIEESRHAVPQVQTGVDAPPVPAAVAAARKSEDLAVQLRPAASRTAIEPPSSTHKVLGLADERPVLAAKPVGNLSGRYSPEALRRPITIADASHSHPQSPTSPTPPLSLDYSYAQAVDALQGAERELDQRPGFHSRDPSKTSLYVKAVDLPSLAGADNLSPTDGRQRPWSARKRPDPSSRWPHHPDIPLDPSAAKKHRRRSMSDARRLRHLEDEVVLQRRDSVEDAIASYLSSPRLSRTVQHPRTGRVISFSEVGDPAGAAVFVCVGMGLTRYVTAFYDDLATTLRLRLVTLDRPGVGGSEPLPPHDRGGPLNWTEDVVAICQALGIESFSLLAHSAGALYAMATALILPNMIQGKVHLLSPWIPPSQLEALATPSAVPAGSLPRSQRLLRVLPASFLKAANSRFMSATSGSFGGPAGKRQVLAAREKGKAESGSPGPRPSTSHAGSRRPTLAAGSGAEQRRESLMLMDRFMPTITPEAFALSLAPSQHPDGTDPPSASRRGSLFLSATASPTDPALEFAQLELSAAEHAARERQLEYTSRLTHRTWELATRDSNPAADLLVCLERNREIGFRYTDVNRRIVITHGSEDKRVPVGNVRWLCEQINARAATLAAGLGGDHGGGGGGADSATGRLESARASWADEGRWGGVGCEVRVLEGQGHGLMASAGVMGGVLEEIAGYWS